MLMSNQGAEFVDYNERPDFIHGYGNESVVADTSVFDQLCPVNPVTGFRDTDLARLADPATPRKERDFILSSLQQLKGRSVPSELSDDDVLSLIPPRYCQDPVEIARFVDAVKDLAAQYIEPTEPPTEPVEPTEPAEPAEPAGN